MHEGFVSFAAGIAAREEAEDAEATFVKASINARNYSGDSPEFFLGESDGDDI